MPRPAAQGPALGKQFAHVHRTWGTGRVYHGKPLQTFGKSQGGYRRHAPRSGMVCPAVAARLIGFRTTTTHYLLPTTYYPLSTTLRALPGSQMPQKLIRIGQEVAGHLDVLHLIPRLLADAVL